MLACAVEAAPSSTKPGEVGAYPSKCEAARRIAGLIPPGALILTDSFRGRFSKSKEQRRKQIATWIRALPDTQRDASVRIQLRPLGGSRAPLVVEDAFARCIFSYSSFLKGPYTG